MTYKLNEDSQIKAFGSPMTVAQFAEKHTEGDIINAIGVIEVLVRKGNAKIIDFKTKEENKLDKALKQESVVVAANISDQRIEGQKDYNAQKKREGRLTYEEIQVEYPDFIMASQAEDYYKENLRLKDTEVKKVNGRYYLVVRNITDKELDFINIAYKRDRVVSGAMGVTQKGVDGLTGAVDYTAKNVLTPAFKIGAKGAVSIFKSLASTVARTGATVVTSTSKGIKDTSKEIREDEEILRATRDLINTKDTVKRNMTKLSNSGGGTSSGITIVK